MRSKLLSATAFGSTSWLPTPRQQAPAPEELGGRGQIDAAGRHQADLRQRAAHRLEEGRAHHLGGEHLDDVRPGFPGVRGSPSA